MAVGGGAAGEKPGCSDPQAGAVSRGWAGCPGKLAAWLRPAQLAGTWRLGHRLARSPGKCASYTPHPPPHRLGPGSGPVFVTRWGSREGSQRVPHLSDLLAAPCTWCTQICFGCGNWNTDRDRTKSDPWRAGRPGAACGTYQTSI